mgnify:CR=1 FL=1|jgi:hypothetical protein
MSVKLLIQSSFAPNVYDLAAFFRVEQVLMLGCQPWSRKSRTHRAAIRNRDQRQWIGLPIRTEDKKKLISQVRIDSKQDWTGPFLNAVQHSYAKARYHDYYWKEFEALIMEASKHERLWDFNEYVFRGLLEFTSLNYLLEKIKLLPEPYTLYKDVEVLVQNNRLDNLETSEAEKIRKKSGYTYIQECLSNTYMSPILTAKTSYIPGLRYPQHHGDFMEHCSLIDLLFEQGPESYSYLKFKSPIS